ncbi:MAG: DMT family transporter [Alphaproteobacteria bacterium]|nr:DMT family transporter [Alphaproteobacteria bacterium]
MSDQAALHAANMRGIVAVLVSMALFVLSDSVVKLAGEMMPATEIMAVRGVMAVLLMGGVAVATIDRSKWHLVAQPRVVVRASIEAIVAVLFLIALPQLPLADITAIQQVTPIVLTVLSAVVLKEAVGWRRWLAVFAGFVGVVLVIQPTAEGINLFALSALACAALVAVRDIITRGLQPGIPTALVTFTTTLSVCIAGFVGAPLETWHMPTPYGFALLAASAVLVSSANIFIIRAFRGTEVSVVAPFRYAGVVWAIVLGFAIWGHVPNGLAIAGTVILVASGLYIMHREALRRRLARDLPEPHG